MEKMIIKKKTKGLILLVFFGFIIIENDFILEYLIDQYSLFGYVIGLVIVMTLWVIVYLVKSTTLQWIEKYNTLKANEVAIQENKINN